MVSSKKANGASSAFISILLAALLALMLVPISTPQPAQATPSDQTISDQEIEALLAAGDYVPGEALVIIDETAQADNSTLRSLGTDLISSAESLITASDDEYEQTADNATISSEPISTLAFTQSTANDEAVSVRLITNTGLSTEELLYQLKDDPRVLAVEPNYVAQCDDNEYASSSITPQDTSSVLPASDTNDLTRYQWGNSNNPSGYSQKTNWVKDKTVSNFDIGPNGWQDNRTAPGSTNATGTVAIVDSGIDHNHPDLDDVVRNDMTAFNNKGGDFGYCPWSADPSDTMDVFHHGTHCAGIIASEWNDFGTSGVASGTKLVAVKAAFDDGAVAIANVIQGYEYLAESMNNGLDLKAINNSWGSFNISRALSLAVTKLGNLGAISVFAAGNNSKNTDNSVYITSNLSNNPYAVVVAASDTKALLSKFTNYGSVTTNIVAPGTGILSTYPLLLSKYLPDAVDESTSTTKNIVYETFNSTSPEVKFYGKDPHLTASTLVGSSTSATYFDSAGMNSWGVQFKDMGDSVNEYGDPTKCLYLTVDLADEQQRNSLEHIGFYTCLRSDNEVLTFFDVSVLCKNGENTEKWVTSKFKNESTNEWVHHWFDITKECTSKNMAPYYLDDKTLVVKVAFDLPNGVSFANDDMFCIDTFGLAGDGVLVPYAYSNGTSMAAPAATGAAAVLAALETGSTASDSDKAKLRAARLQGSVQTTTGNFSNVCTSGGALDLRVAQNNTYVPVLNEASVAQVQGSAEITLSGYFFGTNEGTVLVGGEAATITAWSENSVTVVCPTSVSSGLVEISLTSSSSKTGKMTRMLELPSPPHPSNTPLYEREYTLPFDQGFNSDDTGEVPLLGLGGFLYAVSFDDPTEVVFWKLDTNTGHWTKCPAMPGKIQTCSATTYDGKIYLTGINAAGTETILYSLDPTTDTWTDHKTEKMPAFTTLVNCNERLVTVGGMDNTGTTEIDTVSIYDLATDTLAQTATLTKPARDLKVAVHGSKILATAGTTSDDGFGVDLIDIDTGTVKDLSSALPSFSATRDNYYSPASVEQGFVLCGASATTNARAVTFDDQDTYLLDVATLDTNAKFEAFNKRASRSQLFFVSSTSHRDTLYTYGVSYFEEGGYVLRATKVQTLAQPGDLYSITYHNVDASEHSNPASYSPTSLPQTLKNAQDRSDERFAGWYTNADFSGDAITEIPATAAGDVELWAQWKTDVSPDPTPTPDPSDSGNTSDSGNILSKAGDILPVAIIAFATVILLACIVLARIARSRTRLK